LFLASSLASHITGEVLNVNGGAVLCGETRGQKVSTKTQKLSNTTKLFCVCCPFVSFLVFKMVNPGLEVLLKSKLDLLKGSRVGLIVNPASINSRFEHAPDLFNPQHRNRT